jgi:uncharacterized membrane protein YtjA (UPF0391 family)
MEPAFNNAEDMLRRVSPEGRAIAHRQRVERQRRTARQIGLCVGLAIALWLISFSLSFAGVAGPAVTGAAIVLFLIGCAAIVVRFQPKRITSSQLPAVPLGQVALRVREWLEEHRRSLPRSAQPIVDALTHQLTELGPQLAKVEPNGPASHAVRKLIAVELPELLERYRNIPPSVGQREAASQLVQGLQIIEGEVGRMSSDLASGSFDALATQNRYLQLKYDAGLSGS